MLLSWSIFCKFGITFATYITMKKIIYILLVAVFTSASSLAQEINWVTLDEAIELQKTNPKKIMMDVYTSWCGPCKMLDRNTFHNSDVVAYVNEIYEAIAGDAEGNESISYKDKTFDNPRFDPAKANKRNSTHKLTSYLKVSAYPTIVFFDEKGDFISPIVGYQKPQQLELYLKMFKDDHHKNMASQKDFNEFYKAFKPEFKI